MNWRSFIIAAICTFIADQVCRWLGLGKTGGYVAGAVGLLIFVWLLSRSEKNAAASRSTPAPKDPDRR